MQTISVCHLGFDPQHPTKGSVRVPLYKLFNVPPLYSCSLPFPHWTLSPTSSPHQIVLLLWGLHQGAPLQGLSLWTPNFIVMTFFPETRTPVVHRTHLTVSISMTICLGFHGTVPVCTYIPSEILNSVPFPTQKHPSLDNKLRTFIHVSKISPPLPTVNDGDSSTFLCTHLHICSQ